eukprot:8605234-Pyramimonas_sp.AAC.1
MAKSVFSRKRSPAEYDRHGIPTGSNATCRASCSGALPSVGWRSSQSSPAKWHRLVGASQLAHGRARRAIRRDRQAPVGRLGGRPGEFRRRHGRAVSGLLHHAQDGSRAPCPRAT